MLREGIGSTKYSKAFFFIFLGFIAINVFLLSWLHMFPFIDLSFHLAAATIYRHFNELGNQFHQFYDVKAFLKPNTFHMWFCSLSFFPNVESGNKLFYILYVVLLPLSVFLIIKHIQGNIWLSLVSLAFIYNICAIFGNTGYTLGIPTFIITFYFFIRGIQKENLAYKAIAAGLLVLLYFEHALITLFAVLVFSLSIMAVYRRSFLKFSQNIILLLPVFVLIIIWRTGEESASYHTSDFLIKYYKGEYLSTLPKRINFLYMDYLFLFSNKSWGRWIGTAFNLAIYLPLAWLILKDRKSFIASLENNNILCLWIFFLSALACHIVLPNQIPNQIMILYERFPTMVTLSGLMLLSWYLGNAYFKFSMIGSLAVAMISTCLWIDFFVGFQNENKFFTKDIFPDKIKNMRLVGLISNYYYRNVEVYIMYPDFYITWKKGIQATSAIDYGLGSVRRKASKKILPVYDHWLVKKGVYNHQYDGMEYVLCNGPLPSTFDAFMSNYKIEKQSGPWKLFKIIQKE